MSDALSVSGIATLVGSTNSATIIVLAAQRASNLWASAPIVNGIPFIKISRRGLARVSSSLSHSLLHFLQTTLTRRLPAWPCFLIFVVTGCKPRQLVWPWVCESVGVRGNSWRSQSGKICSFVRRVPEAPPQKMHLAATGFQSFEPGLGLDRATALSALSKSFGSSEASALRASSRKRLWRSASVSLGFRDCFVAMSPP
jgi:hypothetical protein